ncbi:MAG TPA: carboxyl transferase domain-containing protein [Phycisphaerae bacterium]|nr:carboxyl transferase domain-containing protein [Phycisphaerae bacterium]
MAFVLPFESEIHAIEEQLAGMSAHDPAYAMTRASLQALEREVYPRLGAYERFLLSGQPLRPKTLDYVRHIFYDVRLHYNPDVKGDHLMVGGEGKVDIDGRPVDLIFIGQQTGPCSRKEELLRLPVSEYKRWNQGMGYPDGFRKGVYFMELAEQRGWPIVVFVDTPGGDPSELSEEEGQAFAINNVIHKTTALKVPNLAYVISQGASGGAIAITATSRTIMNEYATYMVISPGGCASILFRNRSPESIHKAAEGLRLTSADALRQGTMDEVVEEGLHPGHRYPQELLAKGKEAVVRNLALMLEDDEGTAERVRREKFFAMGVWGESKERRRPSALADLARQQDEVYTRLQKVLTDYLAEENRRENQNNGDPLDEEAAAVRAEARLNVARLIYAVEKEDAEYLRKVLAVDDLPLSKNQWAELREFALARRYGHTEGAKTLHPNGGDAPYRRQHPVDWIRRITESGSFREFEETIAYCSIDQLRFPQYQEALARGIKATGLETGLVTGAARIDGHDVVLAVNNFGLVGASLCDEIGEKFRYAAQQALEAETPLISIAMGGGARMQEGAPSMHRNIPKVHHALNQLEEAGVPHISVICDPTLGGTAISYGLRGDYMMVVQHSANIGFSGKRVVEQFQERKVARDFQHATWLLRRGFVDERVATEDLRHRLTELLQHIADGGRLADLQTHRPRPWKPTQEVALDAPSVGNRAADQRTGRSSRTVLSA